MHLSTFFYYLGLAAAKGRAAQEEASTPPDSGPNSRPVGFFAAVFRRSLLAASGPLPAGAGRLPSHAGGLRILRDAPGGDLPPRSGDLRRFRQPLAIPIPPLRGTGRLSVDNGGCRLRPPCCFDFTLIRSIAKLR